MTIDLEDRFVGCLLGLAIADALGALFEGRTPQHLQSLFSQPLDIIDYPTNRLFYTDDTQMAIGIAETLIDCREIVQQHLCAAFVQNYVPSRGYGSGARRILEAMKNGGDYNRIAESYFPGGSYGNGAAMRVAPVGLFFHHDIPRLLEQAELSSLPTHRHPLGMEGAQLLAMAVGWCCRRNSFDRDDLFSQQLSASRNDLYRKKLQFASTIYDRSKLAELGNGIEAQESVVTAIASFALTPDSYSDTIANVIFLGGDTDTLAAMAGALSGAYLGSAAIPNHLLNLLEDNEKGRTYIMQLARRLFEVSQRAQSVPNG